MIAIRTGQLRFVFIIFLGIGAFALDARAYNDDGIPSWCSKAKSSLEKAICQVDSKDEYEQETVAAYDNSLSTLFRALLNMKSGKEKDAALASEKTWQEKREQCAQYIKSKIDFKNCIVPRYQQRIAEVWKQIEISVFNLRRSEFSKFKLISYKNPNYGFEFKYPADWILKDNTHGLVTLRMKGEDDTNGKMALGVETAATSRKDCTYHDKDLSKDQIRQLYQGTSSIDDQDFEKFEHGFIGGTESHYFKFFNSHCYTISISDERYNACTRGVDYPGSAFYDCKLKNLVPIKDISSYADFVLATIRFSRGKTQSNEDLSLK
jgi:uncharacterized protein